MVRVILILIALMVAFLSWQHRPEILRAVGMCPEDISQC